MSSLRSYLLILIVFLIPSCASMTTVRQHPDYKDTIHSCTNMAILPPTAEVNTVDVLKKKERMYEYESHLEKIIHQEIAPAIRAKGYSVQVLSNSDIHNKKLYSSLARVRANYNAAREELYAKPIWKEQEAFVITKNVGPSSADFCSNHKGDMLLMIDYVGVTQTNGARALGFATDLLLGTSSNVENSVMVIGIVDAKSGNILWTNMSTTAKDIFSSGLSKLSAADKIDIKNVNRLISFALDKLANKK